MKRITVLATVVQLGRRRYDPSREMVLLANLAPLDAGEELSPIEWINAGRWSDDLTPGDVIQVDLQQNDDQHFSHPSKCVRVDWRNRFRSPLLQDAIAQIKQVPLQASMTETRSAVIFSVR